jgi:hypothetical protein
MQLALGHRACVRSGETPASGLTYRNHGSVSKW